MAEFTNPYADLGRPLTKIEVVEGWLWELKHNPATEAVMYRIRKRYGQDCTTKEQGLAKLEQELEKLKKEE